MQDLGFISRCLAQVRTTVAQILDTKPVAPWNTTRPHTFWQPLLCRSSQLIPKPDYNFSRFRHIFLLTSCMFFLTLPSISQVWASSFLPNEPALSDRCQKAFYEKYQEPLLLQYAKQEVAKKVLLNNLSRATRHFEKWP